jgi:hypothetical protein
MQTNHPFYILSNLGFREVNGYNEKERELPSTFQNLQLEEPRKVKKVPESLRISRNLQE